MKCSYCRKYFYGEAFILNEDGDFACSKTCEKKYIKDRDHFFNTVIHDDRLMDKWWKEEE